MKRRINIASAILHQPKVLFMDEPTVGVDPQSRNRIFEVVETLNQQGMTIVYTTHYMEEVERLCNRIAIIDGGNIIAQGTLAELQKESSAKETITIQFQSINANQLTALQKRFRIVVQDTLSLTIACDINKELAAIISFCNAEQLQIEDLTLNKVNLEGIFLSLTGKQLRD